jgi:hypothetical protein
LPDRYSTSGSPSSVSQPMLASWCIKGASVFVYSSVGTGLRTKAWGLRIPSLNPACDLALWETSVTVHHEL